MFHEYEITHNGQTMGNWSLMKAKQINLQEWESFGGGGYGESFYNKTDDSVILKLNKTSVSAEKAHEPSGPQSVPQAYPPYGQSHVAPLL